MHFEVHLQLECDLYLRGVCRSREECGGSQTPTVRVPLQKGPAPEVCTRSRAAAHLQSESADPEGQVHIECVQSAAVFCYQSDRRVTHGGQDVCLGDERAVGAAAGHFDPGELESSDGRLSRALRRHLPAEHGLHRAVHRLKPR